MNRGVSWLQSPIDGSLWVALLKHLAYQEVMLMPLAGLVGFTVIPRNSPRNTGMTGGAQFCCSRTLWGNFRDKEPWCRIWWLPWILWKFAYAKVRKITNNTMMRRTSVSPVTVKNAWQVMNSERKTCAFFLLRYENKTKSLFLVNEKILYFVILYILKEFFSK